MSIAISLKVHDGVVLAADSASTLSLTTASGSAGVVTVYNNANKIFNLKKGLPIGCVTFGGGSIGNSSIATLLKDFRRELTSGALKLSPTDYSVEDVTKKLGVFLNDEVKTKAASRAAAPTRPIGITVAGYSSGDSLAEEWSLDLKGPDDYAVGKVRERDECGIRWGGQGEALERLVVGFSSAVVRVLTEVADDGKTAEELIAVLRANATAPMIQPAMPIQDAIDLSKFLVDTSIMFHRFMPGAPTVGGPVEIAAITKHEGFKWVARKHYWEIEYNREELQ